MWITDTFAQDGIEFITQRPKSIIADSRAGSAPHTGGEGWTNAILLLVYPQVSNEFTSTIIDAFKGEIIVAAGTQNENGFTGFTNETISVWMAREKPEFERVVQIPLPSFAGKDEALCIFVKRKDMAEAS